MQANAAGLARASEKFQAWIPPTAFFQLEIAKEHQFAASELGELWGLSEDTIRELFEDEPGVLVMGWEDSRTKARCKMLRIPESVAVRVHRELSAR